ncbi:cation-dependent mannose-6-phosphate receptor-like [Biomphalaria glabrata]|uniref:Autophagy-related protein 27 n=1 Tax=Biomphalaria glabrata TaxID=6526 RepID=A0A9U8EJL6_BIOGL|nr:cation-dependent mannose-6-phosphate receptor-like [Biomphalaria glabrata]
MLFKSRFHLVLCVLVGGAYGVDPRQCNKIDSCSCKFADNGAVVNLRPLAKSNGASLFKDIYAKDGYYYSYNPCVPFDEEECHSASMCKRLSTNSSVSLVADQNNVNFGPNENGVQLTYLPSGLGNIVTVSFKCVQNSKPLFIPYGFDNVTKQYNFEVETMCACDNACHTAPETGGISTGSILLIIFFVMIFLYLTIGAINGKINGQSSGLQVLPHYEFWVGFPGLVKDGCLFAVRCVCCSTGVTSYDKV